MKLSFFLILFVFYSNLSAQEKNTVEESITLGSKDTVIFLSNLSVDIPQSNPKKITDNRVFQSTKIPVSLFILSGLSYPFEHYIRDVRNYQLPEFHYQYDDYLQYAPGIATFGLKTAGIDGHSDWGRLLTSSSISATTTFILVSGIKYTAKKERPDGSARNSFPSGHTATAFLTATWLHKEYGLTRSPLYSIAGYTIATLTGISRQLNNRHWFSDVLFGAGIGCLSAEIGYWAGDLIFKDKGIKTPYEKRDYVNLKESKPSFIGLNMGYVVSNDINLMNEIEFENTGGYSVAAEGAWFINPYVGFGGKLSSNTINFAFNTKKYYEYRPEDKNYIKEIYGDFSGIYSLNAGAYFALPLSNQFSLGTKLLGGIAYSSSSELQFEMYPTPEYPEGRRINYLNADRDMDWSLETGFSATFLLNRNLGVRFFTDYLFSEAEITFKKIQDINAASPVYLRSRSDRFGTHNLVMGLSVNAYFF